MFNTIYWAPVIPKELLGSLPDYVKVDVYRSEIDNGWIVSFYNPKLDSILKIGLRHCDALNGVSFERCVRLAVKSCNSQWNTPLHRAMK